MMVFFSCSQTRWGSPSGGKHNMMCVTVHVSTALRAMPSATGEAGPAPVAVQPGAPSGGMSPEFSEWGVMGCGL